ncbi:MAG: hypothetical protein ABSC20_11595 [Candidatus Bathyarchaeia archaeon]|jgi:hypothetical protein
MAKKERHPNYDTPEASLTWGYKCSGKALSSLREQDIKNTRKAIYDVRESIRDALFLLKNPKKNNSEQKQ